MREAELMPLIFYESNEIAHPVEFVQNFLVLWEQDGREPFRMYTGSKAAPEITPGLLEARLTFSEKDKRDKLKSLRLKTSLKQNNIVATFLFEHPNSIPFAGRERRSSVSVDIPISKIKEEPYRPERLLEFFINLLSNKRVNQANIQIISTIELEEGVNEALFDMLNYLRNKDYVFPARPLPPDADPYESDYCLTLRGTPLLSWRSSVCETTESWLAAGWGLDSVDCPEMDALRETLNEGFDCLEKAVPALSPLLELLPSGLYVLAEGDAYPADGGGRFFWDVPDQLTYGPATAMSYLTDDDYQYKCQHRPPVFLYPSQRRSRLNMDRVNYYQERLQQDGLQPHGMALHVVEGVSVLLDGHHKAAAAALLGRTLPCLTILRLNYCLMSPKAISIACRRYEASAGGFGPLIIPVEDMGGVKLPENPWVFAKNTDPLPEGRLADSELPEILLSAGAKYPTAEGYALVTAAEIDYPTDQELEEWLEEPLTHRGSLRAALVLLRSRGDPRLKKTALLCAAVGGQNCSLKEEAFQVLAEMKGDPDVEAFFIDYFVKQEEPPRVQSSWEERLTNIAHSFWG